MHITLEHITSYTHVDMCAHSTRSQSDSFIHFTYLTPAATHPPRRPNPGSLLNKCNASKCGLY